MQADPRASIAPKDDWGGTASGFTPPELDEQIHERVVIAEEIAGRGIDRGGTGASLPGRQGRLCAPAKIIGLEALVRWNHPTRGILTPECVSFRSLSATGSILALGRWVIDEGPAARFRAWRDQGCRRTPGVAINVFRSAAPGAAGSARTRGPRKAFLNGAFSAGDIELELTESVLMEARGEDHRRDPRPAGRNIVRVAIDDFGAGYSSLRLFDQTLGINRLKIAQALIVPIPSEFAEVCGGCSGRRSISPIRSTSRSLQKAVETKAPRRFFSSPRDANRRRAITSVGH